MLPGLSRPVRVVLLALALVPTLRTAHMIWSRFPASILTPNGSTVLQDYLVMWVSGRLAAAGQTAMLAVPAAYDAAVAGLLGVGIERVPWFYPPHLMLLSTPLSLLPPLWSMAAWTVLGCGLLWLALRATGLPLGARAAVMACPALWESIVDGQNGALLTAGMVGGITLAGRRPVLAGLCVSVLSVKPQLAIVVPIFLVAGRHWRALLWAGVFGAAWVLASILCFGVTPWIEYVTLIVPQARGMHLTANGAPFGTFYYQLLVVTAFGFVRALGGGIELANVVQAGASLLAVVGAYRLGARPGVPPLLRLAGVLALLPLATPYAMTYDMTGPAMVAAVLAVVAPSPAVLCAAACAWLWPGLSLYLGVAGVPGLGVVVFGALAFVAWRAARGQRGPAVVPAMA